MNKKNSYKTISNIDEYQDFIDEVVKICPYPVYMNGRRMDKRKFVSETALDDAEDWFDNNVLVSYFINKNSKEILIFVGK